jgi:dolichol-phosphate mannosyltransferase
MISSKPKVVIIVPTYNERENISRLIPILLDQTFPPLTEHYQLHILIVDDSSPDKTSEVAQKFASKSPQVHLLLNQKKSGLGGAYTKGMRYALDKLSADIVFEFDADLSHNPKKIKPMLEKLSQGYDVVLGSRYIKGGSIPADWGLHRKFLSIFGNKIIQLIITNFSISDWTTGFRGIKRHVVEAVLPELSEAKFSGYTFQIGFLHKAVRKNFKVAEVPLQFVDRDHGESKLGTEYIVNTLKYIIKVRMQEIVNHRLFRFGMVGAIGAIVQLTTLTLFRLFLPFQLAYFLSVEMAVISNFIWSNLWTFADRKLASKELGSKFIQFNVASAGSIVIQQVVALVGQATIGLRPLILLPFLAFWIDSGIVFALVGILLGMVWNYLAYTTFIWKKK